ncbi:putative inorganic phosphate cotransporter like protein [Argiope bruennichi]|uniref:Putative inorganic phosphate cotransporter like protein n=1 Tax=Argiope bruennichi TaxID=94029 RepID=A0A8T0FFN6_ARGBR|nr:putative inorganic phosphate cotransporter like protein [Argiope bruennichi]
MREDTKSAEDIHQSKTYNDTEIKRDCNNSKMSSISDNLKCSNASAEEIIQNPGALISAFSAGTLCASSNLGGWPSVYYIYGSIGLVQCFCVQQFLYESPKIHPKITEEEKSYILHYQEADLNKKRPPTPWKDITRSIPVYAMTYAMFGAYWAATHLLTIHPIFLTTMLHFSLEENGFLVSLTFVIQIILSFGTSFVSNWLNRHNLVGVDKLRKGINFLGTLMGLTTTAASSAAFILPLIYGKLIQEEQSLAQWNKIYFISIAVIMSGGIIFCLFGSAEIQPWNYTSEDQRRNNCSKDGKKKDKIDETVTAIEAVVHL